MLVPKSPPLGATSTHRPARDEVFAAAGRLSRVENVNVDMSRVTPANLADLAETRVEQLFLGGVDDMSAELLTQMGRLRPLTGLNISGPKAGANTAAIRAIALMPRLELLDLQGFASLQNDDLILLGQFTQLQRLSMLQSPQDDSFLDHWQGLKRINMLELPSTRITDARLRALMGRSTGLGGMRFDGSLLTDAGVAALGQPPNLRSMNLLGRPTAAHDLTDASLVTIGRIRWLATLGLTTGRFTEAGLDALADLPLQELSLGSVESLSEAGMKRLLGSRCFLRLGLAGPAITDAVLPLLAGHLHPQGTLDLSRSAITDDGMRHLAALRVADLNLSQTALTDVGLAALATGITARELIASDTKITPAGTAAFRAARSGTSLQVGPAPAGN